MIKMKIQAGHNKKCNGNKKNIQEKVKDTKNNDNKELVFKCHQSDL